MKLFHISDLHIGKRVNGFSMMEDQAYILNQIVDLSREHRPDAILIAGDLYDRSMPSAEAVELADDFLYQFVRLEIPVFLISGNHDCAERIAYGGRMMEKAGIYVSRVFDGAMQKYTLGQRRSVQTDTENYNSYSIEKTGAEFQDEKKVDIWLLPYIRPAQVRRFYPEEEIETTQQAVEVILKHTPLNKDRINVLVMHQFLAGADVCESEEVSVGGSDQIDVTVTDAFDYVALGHLHRPQKVGRETVRYCGSPLKYSFSEAGHRKSVTVVEIPGKDSADDSVGAGSDRRRKETEHDRIRISQIPLQPRLDLREIKGPIEELLRPEVYEAANPQDYLHVTLTDRGEVLDAIGRLRDVYPNIMRLDFETSDAVAQEQQEIQVEDKSPMELFEEFFLQQNGYELNKEQKALVREIWEKDFAEKEYAAWTEKGGDRV